MTNRERLIEIAQTVLPTQRLDGVSDADIARRVLDAEKRHYDDDRADAFYIYYAIYAHQQIPDDEVVVQRKEKTS